MWALGGIRTQLRLHCLGQLLSIKPNLWLLINIAYSHKKKSLKPESRSAFTHLSPFLFIKKQKSSQWSNATQMVASCSTLFFTPDFLLQDSTLRVMQFHSWCLRSARNSNGGYKCKLLIKRSLQWLLDTALIFEPLGNAFTTEKAATTEPNLFLACHSVGPLSLPAPVQPLCPSSTTHSTPTHGPWQSDLQGPLQQQDCRNRQCHSSTQNKALCICGSWANCAHHYISGYNTTARKCQWKLPRWKATIWVQRRISPGPIQCGRTQARVGCTSHLWHGICIRGLGHSVWWVFCPCFGSDHREVADLWRCGWSHLHGSRWISTRTLHLPHRCLHLTQQCGHRYHCGLSSV